MKMRPTSKAQKTIISKEDWKRFTDAIEGISEKAAVDIRMGIVGGELRNRLGRNPGPFELWDTETMDIAIGMVYDIIEFDGAASAEIAMAMYDELGNLEKKIIEPAVPADIPDTSEVAKMMYGVKKSSGDVNEVARAGKRMVKTVSQDTLLKNAARDGAEFAWIPNGSETCFFCIMLASRGWQNISKVSLRKGHAEHIHNNCKCCYMIRHSDNIEVEGYDPGDYEELYYKYWGDPNQYRREQYDEIKDERNAKRRKEYAKKTLHTKDDPIRDIIGPAEVSHPELLRDVMDYLVKENVKIIRRDVGMGYQPNPTPGKPGQVVMEHGASISAWLHEKQHVEDDKESGWNGFRNMSNPQKVIEMETKAYQVEIDFCKKLGYNEIVDKLIVLKEKAIKEV